MESDQKILLFLLNFSVKWICSSFWRLNLNILETVGREDIFSVICLFVRISSDSVLPLKQPGAPPPHTHISASPPSSGWHKSPGSKTRASNAKQGGPERIFFWNFVNIKNGKDSFSFSWLFTCSCWEEFCFNFQTLHQNFSEGLILHYWHFFGMFQNMNYNVNITRELTWTL